MTSSWSQISLILQIVEVVWLKIATKYNVIIAALSILNILLLCGITTHITLVLELSFASF